VPGFNCSISLRVASSIWALAGGVASTVPITTKLLIRTSKFVIFNLPGWEYGGQCDRLCGEQHICGTPRAPGGWYRLSLSGTVNPSYA
jgi:hypothetical protein